MKKIGLLGGTFNPIHNGHLAIAQTALESEGLDEVLFIPSYLPPHKQTGNVLDSNHRYEMVRLAIKDNPHFSVSDIEINRGGKSYSIDTVEAIAKEMTRKAKLYFIIGADSIDGLKNWKRIDDLCALVNFIAVHRYGVDKVQSSIKVKQIPMPALEISSSQLRNKMQHGKSIQYLVPERVLKYIRKNNLYQP
ncbi:MAG: nicotinate-nucleotide adenylyltransferase [Candidatus Omnitrophica bacterium]|nr:nicotinate-nucleotide adenylyltransferase [Candidatus Omnitrophota bacterium]